jgi:magnesium-transporting ATPase (P-type)
MTIGYIARYISSKSPADLGPYIIQSLFTILPPSLYAATIYVIYGRVVLFVRSPEASLIRPTRVTKIFVIGDVVAFFMQAGGGGMMSQASMVDVGQKLMLIGLFVQLAFFGLFLVISIVFRKRMRSTPARYTLRPGKHSWYTLLLLLLAAAAIIILRCVFRIIEFGQGHDGYLASHEAFLYLFDALPMLGVQIMFHVIHAGDVFPLNFTMGKRLDGDSDQMELNERV